MCAASSGSSSRLDNEAARADICKQPHTPSQQQQHPHGPTQHAPSGSKLTQGLAAHRHSSPARAEESTTRPEQGGAVRAPPHLAPAAPSAASMVCRSHQDHRSQYDHQHLSVPCDSDGASAASPAGTYLALQGPQPACLLHTAASPCLPSHRGGGGGMLRSKSASSSRLLHELSALRGLAPAGAADDGFSISGGGCVLSALALDLHTNMNTNTHSSARMAIAARRPAAAAAAGADATAGGDADGSYGESCRWGKAGIAGGALVSSRLSHNGELCLT